MITDLEFNKIVAGADPSKINLYKNEIFKAMEEFKIDTKLRQAMFLAHIMVESGSLNYVAENLNYSAAGLRKIFGKYYRNDAEALAHARQPEKIANRVYANRMNNGNEASGDGWRYRGRGLKQLTGKYNYTLASKDLGVDLLKNPDYLETPEGAARSAAWFWSYNNLNKFADAKDILGSTKAINGGTNGLEDRKKFYDRALNSIDLSSEKQPRNKLVIAQQKLGLTADGVLGPITKKAISEFQKNKKLPVTGDLDELTFNELTK